jgi:hypothetical protein
MLVNAVTTDAHLSHCLLLVVFLTQLLREFFDLLDLFVGRYLVLLATGYILIKFLHFKVFPDFP